MTLQEFYNQEKEYQILAFSYIAEVMNGMLKNGFITRSQWERTTDAYYEYEPFFYDDYSCPCCGPDDYYDDHEYKDGHIRYTSWEDLETENLYAKLSRKDKARNRYYINVKKKRDFGLRSYKRKNG